ncbi:hypothetical protein SAMN02745221_01810 [Thermosyntropha lipolytica DSM 11003]|uniref:Hook-length control protein FliK n=1 Tax=Thermosyntropha lipolytica DSM 11003 TaxID=1123382 RepID=A0A1M5QND2_9FIRM|nr:flagellar hook-length control protein FliK [Thermosyntropha lipolytica]SHH15438.1 hypothetical protein SAMN02745221_01810 [Thermosyntropha lipolytica DSM 11003]
MYSHVSLNKVQLNINFPGEEGLKLSPGEILKGQVKDVKDNGLILIYLKGRLIEALSEVMLKPGDSLYLMVEDFKEGKAYLKVLNPERLNAIANDVLSLRLKEIGISPREQDIMIARKLIQYNLPLTGENIKKLEIGTRLLGEFNARNLEIAAFALARGIPLNKETLGLIAYHLDKNTDLAKLLANIFRLVSSFKQETALTENNRGLDAGWGKMTYEPEGEKQNISREADVKQELRNSRALVPPGGEKIDSSLRQGIDGQGFKTASLPPGMPKFQDAEDDLKLPFRWQPLIEFLKAALKTMPISPEVIREGKLLGRVIKEQWAGETDWLRLLSALLEVMDREEGFKENGKGAELLKNLESLAKEIGGHRLFNVVSRQGGDNNINYYYWAWPVEIDNHTYLLELKISRERKYKNLREEDNLSLAIALDTPRMGKVLFHVNWWRDYKVELRGVVETAPVKEYMEKNIAELVDALSGLGYKVDYLGTRVAADKEEMVLNQIRLASALEEIKPFGIDIKV